tara:strand:- start:704 stop:1183 length:480 start_codon:yes stop_codon:yes gene_type:complete
MNVDEGLTNIQVTLYPTLSVIVHYLINEYIADLIAGENKDQALQNAWDQTVVARKEEWAEIMYQGYKHQRIPYEDFVDAIERIAGPDDLMREVGPILDKYVNNIDKILFKIFRTGISKTVQDNWERFTDDKTKEEFGHDYPFTVSSRKDEIMSSPEWQD